MTAPIVLFVLVLGLAADAAAQAHGAAPKSAAEGHGAASTTAPDSHATPTGEAAADAHGATPKGKAAADDHAAVAAQPARPAPVVSRITSAPSAGASSGHAATDAHAAPAAQERTGYVATGASRRNVAGEHGAGDGRHGSVRPRPVVSGAADLMARTAAAASDDHAGSAPHGAAPAPAPAPVSAAGSDPAPPAGTPSRKPVRLTEVHERLAAALADARKGSGGVAAAAPEAPAHTGSSTSHSSAAGHEASTPRLRVSWPAPRWSLTWPAAGWLPIAWPPFGPPAGHDPPRPR